MASASQLIMMSDPIRQAINKEVEIIHAEDSKIRGCSHLLWTGIPTKENSTARNAVFYGDKAIDRSPCGTGTSSRMAQWAAKGKLRVGDTFVHESIIGSQFVGRVESEAKVGDHAAIVPSIEGWAKVFGENKITIDEKDDPFAHGFQVI